MNIVLDISPIQEFFLLPPDVMLWHFMAYYGWLIIAIIFLMFAKEAWLLYVQGKFVGPIKYTYLALDIPRLNEQSPRAVENLLAYLAGAHSTINWFEKYWEGKVQLIFSLEIVSIDGYTQFIIRTPVDYKNLVESAVYSQYPDAEITEIDDYTEGIPKIYPNDDYDVAGAEFIQSANQMFPIRCYEEFEHKMGPTEIFFKDPMASLMDLCSSLVRGEQLWYQILLIPIGFDWMDEADREIEKIIGKKPKVTGANKLIDQLNMGIAQTSEFVYAFGNDLATQEKEFKPLSMVELKPKQKKQVEGLHQKVSKLGFRAKLRMVYVGKKEVYNPKKVFNGFVGYIKQFSALDLNAFKPDMNYTATSTAFFTKVRRLNERKRRIVTNYINRDWYAGRMPGIYNVEELATVWHFPMDATVKAPMVQKTPAKKAKPPISLPSEETIVYQEALEPIDSLEMETESISPKNIIKEAAKNAAAEESSGQVPSNLPFG
ncbi:MAG TPA: hypothetical protein PKI61_02995 [bacterium]|nr:hypothetical protein [bacterium]HPT29599.1 hypothetical protein [bacterium]